MGDDNRGRTKLDGNRCAVKEKNYGDGKLL
jgi:hypothetical protein